MLKGQKWSKKEDQGQTRGYAVRKASACAGPGSKGNNFLLSVSHNISVEHTENIYLTKKIGTKIQNYLTFSIEEKSLIVTEALLRNFNICFKPSLCS